MRVRQRTLTLLLEKLQPLISWADSKAFDILMACPANSVPWIRATALSRANDPYARNGARVIVPHIASGLNIARSEIASRLL